MSSRKPESNKIINTSNSNNDNKIKLKVTKKSFNIITEIKSGTIQELSELPTVFRRWASVKWFTRLRRQKCLLR